MSQCLAFLFDQKNNDENKILKIKYFNILKENTELLISLNYLKKNILKNIFIKWKINLKNIRRFDLIQNQNIYFLKYIKKFNIKLKINKYFIFWSKYVLYNNTKLICKSLTELDNSINLIFNDSIENNIGFSNFFKIHNLKKENIILKKSIETINESKLCIICFENERDILFKPCNHFCICKKCNKTLINFSDKNNNDKNKNNSCKCPICRKKIKNIVDVSSRIIS